MDTITINLGVVEARYVYKPFGEKININKFGEKVKETKFITNRGYTGHEHIQGTDFIHMNGRVYNPNIGRFLSADPNIFHPFDTQNYNRYSYVQNNPLKYTDSSGYDLESESESTIDDDGTATLGMITVTASRPTKEDENRWAHEDRVESILNGYNDGTGSNNYENWAKRVDPPIEAGFLGPIDWLGAMFTVPAKVAGNTLKGTQMYSSKRAAFRAAKRDAGIPTSQTHKTHKKNLPADSLDMDKRTATDYKFGKKDELDIQHHPKGHKFNDGGSFDTPHFNNYGKYGTKKHYGY